MSYNFSDARYFSFLLIILIKSFLHFMLIHSLRLEFSSIGVTHVLEINLKY